MIQTIALFVDAYRDLNSRKLFWITLFISILLVLLLATVGVEPDSLTFFKWHWEVTMPSLLYRSVLLDNLIFGMWLSWAAVILALISTGGIFPDLITSGAVDLYLSKPIGRARLFVTKYITGLLFVAIQLTIFCGGCFLVVGIRAHDWRPSFFLAIPVVTVMFSYVYAFCVFLGIWMRSTIAAILLAIICWFVFSGIARFDGMMWSLHRALDLTVAHADEDIRYIDAQKPSGKLFDFQPGLLRKRRETDLERIEAAKHFLSWVPIVHGITNVLHVIVPKTFETNDLLDRHLMTDEEIAFAERGEVSPDAPPAMGANPRDLQQAGREHNDALRHASPWYVIGSSLITEGVFVVLAGWIFCRRDY